MKSSELFLTNNSIASDLIKNYEYPYMVLNLIHDFIIKKGEELDENFIKYEENIWIHKTVKVSEIAEIIGPCIIDENTEIRHNAFIRGNAIIGKNCVIGNSCEIKNSIIFDNCQIPHFNYVGDSILGFSAHMGAGAITSNIKSDRTEVKNTGLIKVGAFLGDYVEVGCNCVLNPGTIIGSHTNIYPLTSVRGVIGSNKIVKNMNDIVDKK